MTLSLWRTLAFSICVHSQFPICSFSVLSLCSRTVRSVFSLYSLTGSPWRMISSVFLTSSPCSIMSTTCVLSLNGLYSAMMNAPLLRSRSLWILPLSVGGENPGGEGNGEHGRRYRTGKRAVTPSQTPAVTT